MLHLTSDAINGDAESVQIPWSQFSEWLHCICVVTFDLELGQALEFVYPQHVELSNSEKNNICYLAFPDSNSGCMGDTEYCFRIRRSSIAARNFSSADFTLTKDCPATLLPVMILISGHTPFLDSSLNYL